MKNLAQQFRDGHCEYTFLVEGVPLRVVDPFVDEDGYGAWVYELTEPPADETKPLRYDYAFSTRRVCVNEEPDHSPVECDVRTLQVPDITRRNHRD